MNVRMEITIFYMDVCLICPELFPSTILLMFPEIFIQFSSQKAADSFFTEQLTTEPRWTSVPGSVPHWRGVTALHWQYSHPRMLNQTYSVRGCPYFTSADITRQGHSECLQMLTLGSKGSFKSLCLMKIHIKGGNQSNPHFVWHQKCEISIKIPLLRAKKCQIPTSSPNLLNQNKVYWKKNIF